MATSVEDIISKAILKYPTLSPEGIGKRNTAYSKEHAREMASDEFEEQVDAAIYFLDANPDLIKRKKRNSYGLKHEAEAWHREYREPIYISNGAMIIAAITNGYEVTQVLQSPNANICKPKD